MKNKTKRIFVDDEIIDNEEEWLTGSKKDVVVCFTYYNVKYDRETEKRNWNYRDSLGLAMDRESDGRYKNYEFLITL